MRDAAVGRERLVELRDLISLGQIGIEVILAREDRRRVHRAAERERRTHRQLDRALVEHGQRARQREAHRTGVRVRRRAEVRGAAAEDLRRRLELDVHLEADDHLVAVRARECRASSMRLSAERTLERVRGSEHLPLVEVRRDELSADRQSVDASDRHRHRRDAGEIRRAR